MATASDNFNAGDEDPISGGGNWQSGPGAANDAKIIFGTVQASATSSEAVARRASPTFSANHFAQATVSRSEQTAYAGPAVRINSSTDADHYFLRPNYGADTMAIRRVTDSGSLSSTTLGSTFGTYADDDVLKLVAVGTILVAYQNGSIVATRVDNTFASGQPGLHAYRESSDLANHLDDWSAEDLTVTRLYLPSSGAAPINFAFSAGWEKTSEADRISAVSAKSNTALTDKTCSENVSTTPYDVLARQYCYGPLAAQSIGGVVRGIIRVLESNSAADFRAQLVIKVMASDGSTVRGTLLDFDTQALKNEFPTTAASRMFPLNWDTVALTSVNAQAGDYLVIEIGIRSHNSSTTNRTATFRFGDPTSGSDFTEAEGTTTDNVPWIEFSQAITLQGGLSGTINQVTETDTAQPISINPQRRLIGPNTETDTAQGITGRKTRAIGQVSESDTAQAVTINPLRRLAGQVVETDTAQALSRAKTKAIGQALETDTAQAMTARKSVAVGQATETNTAQGIASRKAVTLAQAVETDLSQAVTRRKTMLIGQVTETDEAQPLTSGLIVQIGQAVETDVAQPITVNPQRRLVGQIAESDLAQGLTVHRTYALGFPTESDLAQALTVRRSYTITPATESNLAQSITARKSLAVATVLEADLAQSIIVSPLRRLIGMVEETDLAQPMTVLNVPLVQLVRLVQIRGTMPALDQSTGSVPGIAVVRAGQPGIDGLRGQ